MKKIKLGGLVDTKNKIGFARWILSYREFSKELVDYREDFDRLRKEFNDKELKLKADNEVLNNYFNERIDVIIDLKEKLTLKNKEYNELKEKVERENNLIIEYTKKIVNLNKNLKDIKQEFAKQSQTIIENADALNSRNREIEELHKELSDKILEIERLKEANKQLIDSKPKKSPRAYLSRQKEVKS